MGRVSEELRKKELRRLKEAERGLLSVLKKGKKYQVAELYSDSDGFAIECAADKLNIKKSKVLSYTRTVKFIKGIFSYLKKVAKDPLYHRDDWEYVYKISDRRKKIEILTSHKNPWLPREYTFGEYVRLERVDEKVKNRTSFVLLR
jgi:signal transduction histidine kinase